ncbi:hypothetical protein AB0G04_09690 [Actinoplanes sp. NPDC023801]|uniref:hypothetical protein n=1 Tax=Actinoplanes sp. NPDC023801 TaxID=3154595 RepID=UPI0033D0F792
MNPAFSEPPQVFPTSGRSVLRTVLVVLFGGAIAVLNTGLAYLVVGTTVVPIVAGLVFCLSFAVAIRLLHQATWLSVLSLLPALFVLVGSVQMAPELALEQRGVRHDVTILDDRVTGKSHTYLLRSDDVGVLREPLTYAGTNPSYRVGDRLTVLVDPRGVVEIEDAARVDSSGKLGLLVAGVASWTVIALLAGWRGHRRRHRRAAEVRRQAGGSLVGDVAAAFADGD